MPLWVNEECIDIPQFTYGCIYTCTLIQHPRDLTKHPQINHFKLRMTRFDCVTCHNPNLFLRFGRQLHSHIQIKSPFPCVYGTFTFAICDIKMIRWFHTVQFSAKCFVPNVCPKLRCRYLFRIAPSFYSKRIRKICGAIDWHQSVSD